MTGGFGLGIQKEEDGQADCQEAAQRTWALTLKEMVWEVGRCIL